MTSFPTEEDRLSTLQRLVEYEAEFEAQGVALREAYEALASSRDRFRQLFEEAPVAFLVLDSHATIVQANSRARTLFGDEEGRELSGRLLLPRIHATHHTPVLAHLDLVRRRKGVAECVVRVAGSEVRHLRMESGLLVRDGKTVVLSALLDVTEQRLAQDAMRGSEARFRALFDASVDACVLLDGASLSITSVNPAFVRLSRVDPELALGRRVSALFPEDQRWAVSATLREALHHGRAGPLAVTLQADEDDEPRRIELYATGVRVSGGLFAMVVLRDVHEQWLAVQRRRALERQLWRVQKVEMIGALASGAAADLGNVLGTVDGVLDVLEGGDESERKAAMATLRRAARRGTELVRGLQGLPRNEEAPGGAHGLETVVAEALALVRRVKPDGVSVGIDVDAACWVRGDLALLAQMLFNLVANAVHAVGFEGHVDVRGFIDVVGPGAVEGLAAGEYVRIEVRDDGPGMPPEVLARAFDAFFTTKSAERGTGLGLALVRRTVEDLGGHVEIDSAPGKGTVATVWLARHDAGVKPRCTERARRTLHLLVVDPDPLVLRATARMLRAAGFRVTSASNSAEALQTVEAGDDVDVALIEVSPGPGFHGLMLMRRLLEGSAPPRLIATTGMVDPELPEDLSERLLAVLRKPFDGDDVRDAIVQVHQPAVQHPAPVVRTSGQEDS